MNDYITSHSWAVDPTGLDVSSLPTAGPTQPKLKPGGGGGGGGGGCDILGVYGKSSSGYDVWIQRCEQMNSIHSRGVVFLVSNAH